ncbi:MAG: hypothetical protein JO057_01875 [Chloroflexi bacterium]|nr:hypothetical protein [Chloroflexota bacterium]
MTPGEREAAGCATASLMPDRPIINLFEFDRVSLILLLPTGALYSN